MLHLVMALACLNTPAVSAPAQVEVPSRTIGAQEERISHLVVDAKEQFLYTAGEKGEVQAWNLGKGELAWESTVRVPLFTGFDLGKETLLYTFGLVNIDALQASDGEAVKGAAIGGPNATMQSTCLVADSKDRWAWLGTDKGVLTRLTPNDVKGWSTRPLKNGGITCMALSTDGKLLVVGGKDKTIRLVNAQSASVDKKKVFEGHEAALSAIAVDAKGKLIASGDKDGTVRICSAKNGKLKIEFAAHEGRVHCLALDPKGKWVAAGGHDGSIKLLPLKKGGKTITLAGKTKDPVVALAFLTKSKELVSAGGGERVTVWDLSEL